MAQSGQGRAQALHFCFQNVIGFIDAGEVAGTAHLFESEGCLESGIGPEIPHRALQGVGSAFECPGITRLHRLSNGGEQVRRGFEEELGHLFEELLVSTHALQGRSQIEDGDSVDFVHAGEQSAERRGCCSTGGPSISESRT